MADQAASPAQLNYEPAQARRRAWTLAGIVCRLAVGGLFIYASIDKIDQPDKFVNEVRQYGMVPLSASNSLGYILPWGELFTGTLLVLGIWRAEMRLILLVMLVTFIIAKGYVLAKGLHIHCGCVPETSPLAFLFEGPWGILLDVGLIALLMLDGVAQRRATVRVTGMAPVAG